jgi:hypothetical protein
MKHCHIRSSNLLSFADESSRLHLFYLATGSRNVPDGWFAPLQRNVNMIDVSQAYSPGIDSAEDTPNGETPLHADPSVESLQQQRQMQNRFIGRHRNQPSGHDTTCENSTVALEAKIRNMAESLIASLRNNPDELSGAVKSYLKNFEELKTDSALVSALKTFGKYTGVAESLT